MIIFTTGILVGIIVEWPHDFDKLTLLYKYATISPYVCKSDDGAKYNISAGSAELEKS